MEQEFEGNSWTELWWTKGNRHRFVVLITAGFFSQWSGNGFVSYYINIVLKQIGITDSTTQQLINGILQIVNFVVALTMCFFVNKIGRRKFFLTSTAGMLAPKALPPTAKQALILTYIRSSNTVHTLKELEKALPSVASINGMQVKEYIQALSDEGQIRVEKIGSGNWYWSFLSEEKRAKDAILSQAREEREILAKALDDLKEKVDSAEQERETDGGEGGVGRVELLHAYDHDKGELNRLRKELDGYRDGDPQEVLRKKEEIEKLKSRAVRWTDNIYCLEGHLRDITDGDREALEGVRRMYYGEEYVESEGLREL
ncbi:hypothetical protein MMC13_006721 [Lambiella insularis]|nr:hypothetical protein [Lambiella insularis]